MNDHNIKQKFSQFRPPQEANDWAQMEALLDQSSDRPSPFLLLGVTAFILFSFVIWLWNQSPTDNMIQDSSSPNSSNPVLVTSQIDQIKLNPSTLLESSNHLAPIQSKSTFYASSHSTNFDIDRKKNDNNQKITAYNTIPQAQQEFVNPIPSLELSLFSRTELPVVQQLHKPLIDTEVSQAIAHSLCFESAVVEIGNTGLGNHKTSSLFGLLYGLHLNSYFSVHSGLYYSRQSIQINSKSTQELDVSLPSNGTWSQFSNEFDLLIAENSVQIPLFLRSQYPIGRFSPYFQLGMGLHFNFNTNYRVTDEDNLENLVTIENQPLYRQVESSIAEANKMENKTLISWNAQIGLQYQFNDNWFGQIHVAYDQYLEHSIAKQSLRRYQAGVGIGYLFSGR